MSEILKIAAGIVIGLTVTVFMFHIYFDKIRRGQ